MIPRSRIFDETRGLFGCMGAPQIEPRIRRSCMNETALKPQTSLADALRREARAAPERGIVEARNYGRDREGMIPLGPGEGALPPPPFISEPATRSVAARTTFSTRPRARPPLASAGPRAL